MKYQRTIETPFGCKTLSFDRCKLSAGAGHREINLDGVKIGFCHTVYDGWAADIHYYDRKINITCIGRNLVKMIEKAARIFQSRIDAQASTIEDADARIEWHQARLATATARYEATGDIDDKFEMIRSQEDVWEAETVRTFIEAQA